MPKNPALNNILLIGSGPIIIGQACEFDYSGTQACRALREEGCRVIVVNSNPATIMTDPGLSDRTYVEPLTSDVLAEIIRREKPDAILPTFGGQTALNLAMELHRKGILTQTGVGLIGAQPEVIERSENRGDFRRTMSELGLDLPRSGLANSLEEAEEHVKELGFPVVVRPSYTLGGTGGGLAFNLEEFREAVHRGLAASPVEQVMIEESVLGWKELELEVMRDRADNAVVICGIENVDPMGIHTGDSITVAPIQTLSDVEYQALRDDGLAIVRAVGVETGGCNIQFAVSPVDGRRVVIEMNPRVSRSSALASKATGFPIARVAAKLALGYHLDEIENSITRQSCAAFEPAVDYCVVKAPRFDFEKFQGASNKLGLEMRSVGETMSLGRTFREAMQKALRGLEIGRTGFEPVIPEPGRPEESLEYRLRHPGPYRFFHLKEAFEKGLGTDEIYQLTGIDHWFLDQLLQLHQDEKRLADQLSPFFQQGASAPDGAEAKLWRYFKSQGFSDARIARLIQAANMSDGPGEAQVRARRRRAGVKPVYRAVDTCAGEFPAYTPYYYSTYHGQDGALDRAPVTGRRKIMILGGGPNRIGQGLEFDYCCVQAVLALRADGWETIMVNSNPETVSTDYDLADRLYFEPMTAEDVLAICEEERPDGLIVQFGGQTPLNLARALEEAGFNIIGTKPADIFLAEDRGAFNRLAGELGLLQPEGAQVNNVEAACRVAGRVGYPVMVRPGFVLGGRAMKIVHDEDELRAYLEEALNVAPEGLILIDRFLEDAIEVDVDAICDGHDVLVAAIMEHVEQAGVHSGDSACSIFTHTLSAPIMERIKDHTRRLALALNTKGLINVQYAVQGDRVYVLEANPRASRTVPFVAKATGWPLARLAARVMAGAKIAGLPGPPEPKLPYNAVKEAVMPFDRFPGAKILLGAEMRSTGEVMGLDASFGLAFVKAQLAVNFKLPKSGGVLLSICDNDKKKLLAPARGLARLGYGLYATKGTRDFLERNGLACRLANKMSGARPNILDDMSDGRIVMAINTVSGRTSAKDAQLIRAEGLRRHIPVFTTISALEALVEGLTEELSQKPQVAALQDFYDTEPLVIVRPDGGRPRP